MVVPAYPGRVVILHNVIVETEDVLGCLECLVSRDAEKITSDGMMEFNF